MTTNKLLILKDGKNTSKTIRPRHGQQVSDDDLYLKVEVKFPLSVLCLGAVLFFKNTKHSNKAAEKRMVKNACAWKGIVLWESYIQK